MNKKILISLLIAVGVIGCAYGWYVHNENSYGKYTLKIENIKADNKPNVVVDSNLNEKNGIVINDIKIYNSIQAAIKDVSDNNSNEVKIYVKNGTYKEKVLVNKPNITIIGEDKNNTILTFDDASGIIKREEDGGDGKQTYGTLGCASLTVDEAAKGFSLANLTIENSFDESAHSGMKDKQAVALKSEADESMFVNCRFIGNQDTLFANRNRQYYYNCYIEGDVDFIFGAATAVFENCEIFSVDRPGIKPKGYITAPSTFQEDKLGFLILNSKLKSNVTEDNSVYLGRPWHPSYETKPVISSVVYKNCEMGSHISADGWTTMSKNLPENNDMFEYESYGDGAKESKTRRVLTDDQANQYTKESYLKDWDTNKKLMELS